MTHDVKVKITTIILDKRRLWWQFRIGIDAILKEFDGRVTVSSSICLLLFFQMFLKECIKQNLREQHKNVIEWMFVIFEKNIDDFVAMGGLEGVVEVRPIKITVNEMEHMKENWDWLKTLELTLFILLSSDLIHKIFNNLRF